MNSIFNRISIPISDYKKLLENSSLNKGGVSAYNNENSVKFPMVKIKNGKYSFTSVSDFLDLLTKNIFWNIFFGVADKKKRDDLMNKFTRLRGHILEKYFFELLKKNINSKVLVFQNYISQDKDRVELGDYIEANSESILVVEIKSRQLSSKLKNSGDWTDDDLSFKEIISSPINDTFLNKIRKIEEIPEIKNSGDGSFYRYGVVITYENILSSDYSYQEMIKEIKIKYPKYFECYKNIDFIYIGDIELISGYLKGTTLLELIVEKNNLPQFKNLSFSSYLFSKINLQDNTTEFEKLEKEKKEMWNFLTTKYKFSN